MNFNFFLVAFDPADPSLNARVVHQYIADSKYIDGWWHWLPSVYIVRTKVGQILLSAQLRIVFGMSPHLVLPVNDPTKGTGVLDPEAWEWLNTLGAPKPGTNALTDLLLPPTGKPHPR